MSISVRVKSCISPQGKKQLYNSFYTTLNLLLSVFFLHPLTTDCIYTSRRTTPPHGWQIYTSLTYYQFYSSVAHSANSWFFFNVQPTGKCHRRLYDWVQVQCKAETAFPQPRADESKLESEIGHLHNYCLGIKETLKASDRGRSVTCMWFQYFWRAESCFNALDRS